MRVIWEELNVMAGSVAEIRGMAYGCGVSIGFVLYSYSLYIFNAEGLKMKKNYFFY